MESHLTQPELDQQQSYSLHSGGEFQRMRKDQENLSLREKGLENKQLYTTSEKFSCFPLFGRVCWKIKGFLKVYDVEI